MLERGSSAAISRAPSSGATSSSPPTSSSVGTFGHRRRGGARARLRPRGADRHRAVLLADPVVERRERAVAEPGELAVGVRAPLRRARRARPGEVAVLAARRQVHRPRARRPQPGVVARVRHHDRERVGQRPGMPEQRQVDAARQPVQAAASADDRVQDARLGDPPVGGQHAVAHPGDELAQVDGGIEAVHAPALGALVAQDPRGADRRAPVVRVGVLDDRRVEHHAVDGLRMHPRVVDRDLRPVGDAVDGQLGDPERGADVLEVGDAVVGALERTARTEVRSALADLGGRPRGAHVDRRAADRAPTSRCRAGRRRAGRGARAAARGASGSAARPGSPRCPGRRPARPPRGAAGRGDAAARRPAAPRR